MPRVSAGILLFRRRPEGIQVLLVHPGGPFWKHKDAGAWSIPKGEIGANEDPLQCAKREFQEELGVTPAGHFVPLRPIKQKGGKLVEAFACEGEFDSPLVRSNTFEMEWLPRSGRRVRFPEVDRAEWFSLKTARARINSGQIPLLEEFAQQMQIK